MSDDDWETAADDVGALALGDDAPAGNAWDGEDEDDDALLDGAAWDEDAPKPAAVPVPTKPKKLTKKKIQEKQAKMEEEARRRAAAMSAAEAAAEKAAAQRRVEEADNELTEELFMGGGGGGGGAADAGAEAVPAKEATITNVVAGLQVEKDADFTELGQAVADKVELGDPVQVKLFLDVVLKQCCATFRLDDVNDVKKTVSLLYNQIRQAEVGKKKKGGKKKKFINAGGARDAMDDMAGGGYEDPDDFDFL